MKLQKNRKSSDHIHNTVYSKMKLLQPSGIYIINTKFPAQKPRDQNNLLTVTQPAFCSEIENSIWTRDENHLTQPSQPTYRGQLTSYEQPLNIVLWRNIFVVISRRNRLSFHQGEIRLKAGLSYWTCSKWLKNSQVISEFWYQHETWKLPKQWRKWREKISWI